MILVMIGLHVFWSFTKNRNLENETAEAVDAFLYFYVTAEFVDNIIATR